MLFGLCKHSICLYKIRNCRSIYCRLQLSNLRSYVWPAVDCCVLECSYDATQVALLVVIQGRRGLMLSGFINGNRLNLLNISYLVIFNTTIIPLTEMNPSLLEFPLFKSTKLEAFFYSSQHFQKSLIPSSNTVINMNS